MGWEIHNNYSGTGGVMNKERIYHTKPSITDLEVKYAADAAKNGWGEIRYLACNIKILYLRLKDKIRT